MFNGPRGKLAELWVDSSLSRTFYALRRYISCLHFTVKSLKFFSYVGKFLSVNSPGNVMSISLTVKMFQNVMVTSK